MKLATYGKNNLTGKWYLECGGVSYYTRSKKSLKAYAIDHNITLYWRRDFDA